MNDTFSVRGKRVLVMGLGLHHGGEGVARFMAERGAKVTVTDMKSPAQLAGTLDSLGDLPIRYVLGEHRVEDFTGSDLIIRNPAVPRESKYLQLAREAGVPVEMEMSIFFRLCPAPIIGITGTKGKTTTTLLAGHMLAYCKRDVVVAGNLRISALESLPQITADSIVVLELSSWQLEGLAEARLSPHIAVVTNIYPDHLDRYKGMEDYTDAKKGIGRYQSAADHLILNSEDETVRSFADVSSAKVVWYALDDPGTPDASFVAQDRIILRRDGVEETVCPVSDTRLLGRANVLNTLAAASAVRLAGGTLSGIAEAIRTFDKVPERLELIAEIAGVKFYDDTTSTTPASTVASIQALPKPVVLIAGGSEKHLDFGTLAEAVVRDVSCLVLLAGSATPRLEAALRAAGWEREIRIAESMDEAVACASRLAGPGWSVLMSPACASFGMFVNEFDRGAAFQRAVTELGGDGRHEH